MESESDVSAPMPRLATQSTDLAGAELGNEEMGSVTVAVGKHFVTF